MQRGARAYISEQKARRCKAESNDYNKTLRGEGETKRRGKKTGIVKETDERDIKETR